jgi:hypothetical protein
MSKGKGKQIKSHKEEKAKLDALQERPAASKIKRVETLFEVERKDTSGRVKLRRVAGHPSGAFLLSVVGQFGWEEITPEGAAEWLRLKINQINKKIVELKTQIVVYDAELESLGQRNEVGIQKALQAKATNTIRGKIRAIELEIAECEDEKRRIIGRCELAGLHYEESKAVAGCI